MSMYTTGMLGAYKTGVVTEEFLHCSYPNLEVNHGVVMVGYGKVQHTDRVRGRCKEYWIIRNSWGPMWGEEGYIRLKREQTMKCGTDSTPQDGVACEDDNNPEHVCGQCGMLYDPIIPTGVHVVKETLSEELQ